jgi:hypothetical protein
MTGGRLLHFVAGVVLAGAIAVGSSLAGDPVAMGPTFEVEAGGYVGRPQLADVAGMATGEFVVVWSQAGGEYRTYGRAFAADGTPVSGRCWSGRPTTTTASRRVGTHRSLPTRPHPALGISATSFQELLT